MGGVGPTSLYQLTKGKTVKTKHTERWTDSSLDGSSCRDGPLLKKITSNDRFSYLYAACHFTMQPSIHLRDNRGVGLCSGTAFLTLPRKIIIPR